MPKVRRRNNRKGGKSIGIRLSFKLGTRKNEVSAHFLPTEELIELYLKPRINKDKSKIMQVLRCRGVSIPTNLPTKDETII